MGRTLSFAASPGFLLILIAFFLPWYTVSCSGRPIARASGWQAATSGFQSVESRSPRTEPPSRAGGDGNDPEAAQTTRPRRPRGPTTEGRDRMQAIWVIVVPLLAIAGIALSVLGARSSWPRSRSIRASAAGIGLLVAIVMLAHQSVVNSQLRAQIQVPPASRPGGPDFARMLAEAIKLEVEAGFYVALIGALIAMACAGAAAVFASRERPSGVSVPGG